VGPKTGWQAEGGATLQEWKISFENNAEKCVVLRERKGKRALANFRQEKSTSVLEKEGVLDD